MTPRLLTLIAVGSTLVFARYREPYSQTVWKDEAHCTPQDATYKSPSCSPRCTDHAWGDVTYNSSTNLWACCGTNEACNKPTNETFLAPPPQQLLAAASSQSATTAPSTSTPSANVIGTSTPPAMIEQNPPLNEGPKTVASTSIPGASVTLTSTPSAIVAQSSLNEGAKAGIGVGAASVAVAIIALLAWVIMLRKRLRSPSQAQYSTGKQDASVTNEVLPEEAQRDTTHEHELSGHGWPYEMEGRHQI